MRLGILLKGQEIVMEAVKQDGYVLQYVDKDIEGYREIAMEAVKHSR